MASTATDWNQQFTFAREQAHEENANARQATIRARLDDMRLTKNMTPSVAKTGTFAGYIVGLADLLTD